MIKFTIEEREEFTLLSFELEGPIDPQSLRELRLPKINFKKGVIISGRGPVWLYGFLVHELHPTPWVATNDPRLGAVVVASHHPDYSPGDVIEI